MHKQGFEAGVQTPQLVVCLFVFHIFVLPLTAVNLNYTEGSILGITVIRKRELSP